MKKLQCFEDNQGVLHRTRELCMIADAEHSFTKLVAECTGSGGFSTEEFLMAIRGDALLAKELSILFDIKEQAKDTDTVINPNPTERMQLPF